MRAKYSSIFFNRRRMRVLSTLLVTIYLFSMASCGGGMSGGKEVDDEGDEFSQGVDETQNGNVNLKVGKTTYEVGLRYGTGSNFYIGDMLVIKAIDPSFPDGVEGATFRVRSKDGEFDSGYHPMTFTRDGKTLYALWPTTKLKAADYEVEIEVDRDWESNVSTTKGLNPAEFPTDPFDAFGDWPILKISLKDRMPEPKVLYSNADIHLPFVDLGLGYVRYYRYDSRYFPYKGPFGYGWWFSYGMWLEEHTDGTIEVHEPAGAASYFQSNADGTYAAAPGNPNTLTRDANGWFQLKLLNGYLYQFRNDLKLSSINDGKGSALTFNYDLGGRLIKIDDSSGQYISFNYVGVLNRISAAYDSTGRFVSYSYDADENLVEVTDVGGVKTQYFYDSSHRLTMILFPYGGVRKFIYGTDLCGNENRMLKVIQEDGIETEFACDPSSRGLKVIKPFGAVFGLWQNEIGMPKLIEDPFGKQFAIEYDSNFLLTKMTNQKGESWQINSNSLNLPTQVTDPKSNSMSFGYASKSDWLTSLEDSNQNQTSFVYDAVGNLSEMIYPDGSKEMYAITFDENNKYVEATLRNNQKITYTYDKRGNLIEKLYPDNSKVSYTYDAVGNLTLATNSTGSIAIEYDKHSNPTKVIYPTGEIFEMTYNAAAGRRISLKYPDGFLIKYGYDVYGRLLVIWNQANDILVSYEYDKGNRVIKRTLKNGDYTTYTYDIADRVTSINNYKSDDTLISKIDYEYDATGNRTKRITGSGAEVYAYDSTDQLKDVTYADGSSESFQYDPMGNRLSVNDGTNTDNYTVNSLNQYAQAGGASFQYDKNGNLITRTQAGKVTLYDYDAEDRLTRVTLPDGKNINYDYDPFGRLISRSDVNGTKRFLWDGDQIAVETDGSGTVTSRLIWGNDLDEMISMKQGGTNYFYLQDALRNVTALTDDQGQVVENYDYKVFGVPSKTSSFGNPFLFTGARYDEGTNLIYMRNRWYSPELGRFITTDPIGINGGVNLYKYVNNNPATHADPWGLFNPSSWSKASQSSVGTWLKRGAKNIKSNPTIEAIKKGYKYGSVIGYNWYKYFPDNWLTLGVEWWSTLGFEWWYGGGQCPTFIQPPPDLDPKLLKKISLDVSNEGLAAKITVPINNSLLRSDIPIFGVAGGKNFKNYRVEFGKGKDPKSWKLIEKSNKPQNKNDVGPIEMMAMTGDLDLRGNLATWNTGLKNWEHLPWHAKDDPIDENGIYTIRLVVEGKDGKRIEDRVTGEVGRAIAQVLPGIAISSDKGVVMRFPEQSLTSPFRVFTLISMKESGEQMPALPEGTRLIGEAYKIREPGERFTKDVTLEINPKQSDLKNFNPENIGIFIYDGEKDRWMSKATTWDPNKGVFETILDELPQKRVIAALLFDPTKKQSAQREASIETESPLKPVREGTLIDNNFENGFGSAKTRDRFVGALLSIDENCGLKGKKCLKAVNENYGGNFSFTILDGAFDLNEYSIFSFDYRMRSDVKNDLLFKVDGRWYEFNLTGTDVDYQNKDVNIANLGRLDGFKADDKWHSAKIDLREIFSKVTGHTSVEAIIMADWQVGGYMKLDFGNNRRGAKLFLDNIKIESDGTKQSKIADKILLDDFEGSSEVNRLGGVTSVFSNTGSNRCEAALVAERNQTSASSNRVLEIGYNMKDRDAYGGYYTAMNRRDISGYESIRFKLKTTDDNVPNFSVGIREGESLEWRAKGTLYVSDKKESGWREVVVPLKGMGIPKKRSADGIFISFSHHEGSGKGTIWIDDLALVKSKAERIFVADFEGSEEMNRLNGEYKIDHNGGGLITSATVPDLLDSNRSKNKVHRISFGGSIGKDYGLGGGGFSYAIWETKLKGLDVRGLDHLELNIRGEKGGEKPNFYLSDGVTRVCIRSSELPTIKDEWGEVQLPLKLFEEKGVDLSHLESLQVVFEWEEQSGSIYIDNLKF
ncbi:MAG: RHS repeat-associated core domain-containing protein [Pseudomonadota bacterium]